MKKLYFLTGSQDLYGELTLRQADADGASIADYLSGILDGKGVSVCPLPIIRSSEEAYSACIRAESDPDCIGVIAWMHTFSPAKMWIRGLKVLRKPMLHLHTQFNEKLPYDTIDMDFMNLNQSAHGDREFGFICTRLGIKRDVAVGYYKSESVIAQVRRFADVARALAFGNGLGVAMFGNNMRGVAVTDGDRVESEIKYGWSVNYYAVGDLCDIISEVGEEEIDLKMAEYASSYDMATEDIGAVREQARYEIALERFTKEKAIGALTDTFEDLHGLSQLPGLAVQNMMKKGMGFGPEGDYKTAALGAVLFEMARYRRGATGFLEDYTYDLTDGSECELAAHMLEVSPVFAKERPKIEVHPLGIGGKNPPARLVFDGIAGEGIAVCMIDMGDRFRLVCAEIDLIEPPKATPSLPVAKVMWKLRPDFKTGAAAWIYAGGAHHAVVSTALSADDIRLFARLTDTELVVIDGKTDINELQRTLAQLDRR